MPAHDRFRRLPEGDSGRFDTIVVGAGIGGLVAAGLLARRGQKVLVLDQHYVAGGNTTVFRRKGYEFDIGLHYIGGCHPSGEIPRVLRAAGAHGIEFEEMDPDGFDTFVYPDFRFRMPKGIDAFAARLNEHFPAERAGIERYIALLRQFREVTRLTKDPSAAFRTLPRSLTFLRYATGTLGAFLDTCTKDARLKAVLAGQHGDYGQPPSRAALLIGVGLQMHYLAGSWFPRGGGQAMSDGLADAIESAGSKILLRARVDRILVEKGRAVGVEFESTHLGRRTVRAERVIANADLKETLLRLVPREALSSRTVARTNKYEMSPAIAALFLGIRRDMVAEGYPRTNYWISPRHDLEPGYQAIAEGRFPEAGGAFVSLGSVKDPTNARLAPKGISNLQVMGLVPSQPSAWGISEAEFASGAYSKSPVYRARKAEITRQLLSTAEQVIPGITSQVVYSELSTPITHRRYTRSANGTSYGIALIPSQFLWNRPGPTTEIDGLLLCGASCRTAHGIGGAMASGVMAAAEVLGKGLLGEVYGHSNRGPAATAMAESATPA